MNKKFGTSSIFVLLVAALVARTGANGQLLDRLLSGGGGSRTSETSAVASLQDAQSGSGSQIERQAGGSKLSSELGPMIRRLMSGLQTVKVPAFYEMNKNGSSMGINVLSGLVRFERGKEAERNGLIGPRPMSVRVFGVPVFERGERIRPPSSGNTEPLLPGLGRGTDAEPNEEELPIEP